MDEISRLDGGGKYRAGPGTESMEKHGGISMSIDPAYKGLQDHEEGDDVEFKVMGRLGAMDEEGKRSIDVTSCEVTAMPEAASRVRKESRSGMPPDSMMAEEVE